MKMKFILILALISSNALLAQIRNEAPFFYFAPEFSKSEVLNHSKSALIRHLGTSDIFTKVEIYPISGNGGNEVSSLRYRCKDKQEGGIILGFYGRYTTTASQSYIGHAFKIFNLKQSHEFLNKIEEVFAKNSKYLKDDINNNNIFFSYEDVNVIVTAYSIGLLWQNFDSKWNKSSFDETKKELEKSK